MPTLPTGRELYRKEHHMAEHDWPLKNKLPEGFQFFTKIELIERVGMTPENAIELSLDQALARMNEYWTEIASDERRVRQQQAIDTLASIPTG